MTSSRRRDSEPIEDYLDELLSCLRLPPRATRRLLAETEDHLREAADAAERTGNSRIEAEHAAVARFGSPAQIAAAASRVRRPSAVAVVGTAAWAGVVLAGVGLLAVGVSGVVAAAFNGVAGPRFVGALPQHFAPFACGHWLSLHPGAGSCSVAGMLETSQDAVALRLLAGLVGVAMVALAWWTRGDLSSDPSFRHLLAGSINAVAALSFGVAAAVLLAVSVDTAVRYGSGGVGWFLSGALVSVVAAAFALRGAWRHLRVLRPWNHVLMQPQA